MKLQFINCTWPALSHRSSRRSAVHDVISLPRVWSSEVLGAHASISALLIRQPTVTARNASQQKGRRTAVSSSCKENSPNRPIRCVCNRCFMVGYWEKYFICCAVSVQEIAPCRSTSLGGSGGYIKPEAKAGCCQTAELSHKSCKRDVILSHTSRMSSTFQLTHAKRNVTGTTTILLTPEVENLHIFIAYSKFDHAIKHW